MSLQDWVNQLENDIHGYARWGARITAVIVCPAGERGVIEQNMKAPIGAIDLAPEMRIHGVPIRAAKRMRPGRFFYVLQEEK